MGLTNYTQVLSPIPFDDIDYALAALGETSPSITITSLTSLVTYVNTTSYTTIDNSDDWTTDSTLSVIAIILAALACIAIIHGHCNKSSSAAPKAAAATPQQVPSTTFVANGV
jgi:hypothetical protein